MINKKGRHYKFIQKDVLLLRTTLYNKHPQYTFYVGGSNQIAKIEVDSLFNIK